MTLQADSDGEATLNSDSSLVLAAQQGELSAFEELVRRHQRPLFGYLYRMCGNSADAEEMTQQSLVKAWRGLSGFRGDASFRTWLYRIGINLCLNRRARTRPVEELTEFLPAPETSEPEQTHRARVRDSLVQQALIRLPADQRSALVLSVYQELSYKEIAQAMGKSVRAVDSLLFRAKENLRKTLQPARDKGVI